VPHVPQDFVLFDDAVPALQQQNENIEGLRCEGDVGAVAQQQQPLDGINLKSIEVVKSD
jgi:hypothetical protein